MNTENQTILSPIEVGFDENEDLPVIALSMEVFNASCSGYHAHPRGQLIYAIQGTMLIYTTEHIWLLSPSQCLWIPPALSHQVEFKAAVSLRNIFVHTAYTYSLPVTCCIWTVSPLLKELTQRAACIHEYTRNSPEWRLMHVLLDELLLLEQSPLNIPVPKEKRLQKIVNQFLFMPYERHSIDFWAEIACMSPRNLSRVFFRETGLNFRNWQKQWLLLQAVERLSHGEMVSTIAADLGYASVSAFIETFKQVLGKTPGQYYYPGKQVSH